MRSRTAEPAEWLQKRYECYVVNTGFSETNRQLLAEIMRDIARHFPDAIFCPPPDTLHITLLDWISPLVDYGDQDKAELFQKFKPLYDRAMTEALADIKPVSVHFNQMCVSPSTIYITGEDDGSFQQIRDRFLQKVDLLPTTKLPPQLIHSSLARFTKPIELAPVETFAVETPVNFQQEITEFRLINNHLEPALEFDVLKRYTLGEAA
jgi:hypothetical protein